jgi:uncharacterized HAD superfamily protein
MPGLPLAFSPPGRRGERKMTAIAIDVDGVLADIHSAVFKKLGLNLTIENITKYDFFDDLGVPRKTFWMTYKELWSQQYQLIPLIEEDSPQLLEELRTKCEVHIVTTRPKETYQGTMEWLKLRGINFDEIRLLPPKTDKAQFKEYLFIIDDDPALALRDPARVVLFDRPWNRTVHGRRIRSLKELFDILPAIESPPQRGV